MSNALDLHSRCWNALITAFQGPQAASKEYRLATQILTIHLQRDNPRLPAFARDGLIRKYEPILGRELLRAAENGTLGRVATALGKLRSLGNNVHNSNQLNVARAYSKAHSKVHRAPTFADLRSELQSILKRDLRPNEDRTIRDILNRLKLPLTRAKPGPITSRKFQKRSSSATSVIK